MCDEINGYLRVPLHLRSLFLLLSPQVSFSLCKPHESDIYQIYSRLGITSCEIGYCVDFPLYQPVHPQELLLVGVKVSRHLQTKEEDSAPPPNTPHITNIPACCACQGLIQRICTSTPNTTKFQRMVALIPTRESGVLEIRTARAHKQQYRARRAGLFRTHRALFGNYHK